MLLLGALRLGYGGCGADPFRPALPGRSKVVLNMRRYTPALRQPEQNSGAAEYKLLNLPSSLILLTVL